MGYAPLFDTLTKGTLCGRWPDIGLWPIVLSLSDWRGIVDVTPEYLSRVTGLHIDEVIACMDRFCQPDQYSRSGAEGGRRLVLLEPENRPWGWRIVNLQLYRDKASGQDQIGDGRNAAKVRSYKERHRRTPADTGGHRQTPEDTAGHPGTPTHTADSYSYSDSKSKNQEGARGAPLVVHESLPSEEWGQWLDHRKRKRWPIDSVTLGKQLAELARHDTPTQRDMINRSINAGWQGIFPPKGVNGAAMRPRKPLRTADEIEAEERARAQQRTA